jgi:2'-5' RNA ligase
LSRAKPKRDEDAIRAFVALEIDAAARGRIAGAIERLKPQVAGVRWANPDNLHLTLRFLGASRPNQVLRITELLEEQAPRCRSARLSLGPLGTFPQRGSPRVLWLGVPLPDDVLAMQKSLESAARRAGFEAEQRAFRAHLTLGRFRERAPRPALPELELGEVLLDTVTLFRSQLHPKGAIYTKVASFPLGAPS